MPNHEMEFTTEELSGPKIDRRTSMKLLGVAGLTTLAGCANNSGANNSGANNSGANNSGANNSGANNSGGKLVVGWNLGSFPNLDPPYVTDSKVFAMINNIFRAPLQVKKDFTFEGDLAKNWKVHKDPFAVTLMLRDDVIYHNGDKMIADDLKFAVNRAIEENTNASADVSLLQPIDKGGVEIESDHRITFKFSTPFAPVLSKMASARARAFMPYPPKAVKDKKHKDQFNIKPVGTGPFKVTSHTQGETLKMKAFKDYYGTDADGNQFPYLGALTIRMIKEPSQLLNAIQSEEIHAINQVPYLNASNIKSYNDIDLIQNPGAGYESAVPKVNHPNQKPNKPFSNRKFRAGLAKLIDREEYIQNVLSGYGSKQVGPIHKSIDWAYRKKTGSDGFGGKLKDPTQNFAPEEGKKIIKDEVDTPFSFTVSVPTGDQKTARALIRQWNDNSDGLLKVEINQVTEAQWGDVLTSGDWDMAMAGANNTIDPDPLMYNFFRWDHEFGPADKGYDGVWNEGHYMNDKVQKLLGEQRRVLDREKRKKLIWKLEDHLIHDVARIWVFNPDDLLAKRSSVSNIGIVANNRWFWMTTIDE